MKSVKDNLYKLKFLSEFVVILGYAAILQNDIDIALEAQYVKDKIRELSYDMRVSTIYAVRSSRDSSKEIFQLASLLQVGVAAKEISDGIDDLVEIVIRGGGAHPLLRTVYRMEKFVLKIQISEKSSMLRKTIEGLRLKELDFDILFIRRNKEYIVDDAVNNTPFKKGDIILLRGSEDKAEKVKEIFR